jgi:hypothetical protein
MPSAASGERRRGAVKSLDKPTPGNRVFPHAQNFFLLGEFKWANGRALGHGQTAAAVFAVPKKASVANLWR